MITKLNVVDVEGVSGIGLLELSLLELLIPLLVRTENQFLSSSALKAKCARKDRKMLTP